MDKTEGVAGISEMSVVFLIKKKGIRKRIRKLLFKVLREFLDFNLLFILPKSHRLVLYLQKLFNQKELLLDCGALNA